MRKTASKLPVRRGRKPKQLHPVNEHNEKGNFAYKVEKGVKITQVRSFSLLHKFPFSAMNVGDSFLIPATDPLAKSANSIHYAAKQYAKMHPGFTVTSRQQLNKERRVWRIK